MALVAANVLFFLRPHGFEFVPGIQQACLHPYKVLEGLQVSRLFWSVFLHADETHLFYNMSSLLWKGAQLETAMGPLNFLRLVAELLAMSNVIFVTICKLIAVAFPDYAYTYFNTCAVGFSGVLFAMKVVLSHQSSGWSSIYGIPLPNKYVTWAELVLIQLVTPNASFLGHLAGILAGLLHVALFRPRIAAFGGAPRYAAGGFSTPGRRTPAGADFGGSPHFARQDPAQPAQQSPWAAPARPTPRRSLFRRRWWSHISAQHLAAAAVLAAIAVGTNPDEAHFAAFVREYTQKGLGFWPGAALGALVWLQGRTGQGLKRWNLGLFSVARYQSFWFLGALNTWIPIPVQWMSDLVSQRYQQIVKGDHLGVATPLEGIIGFCVLLFLLRAIIPARFLNDHFVVARENALRRPWTFLSANLYTDNLYSLVGNVQVLLTLGPALQQTLGHRRFLLLFLAGGLIANIAAFIGNVVLKQRVLWSTKGATSAVYALLACHVMVDPYRKFVWLFNLELNSLGLLAAKLLYEYVARNTGAGNLWQFWAHLWGAATGVVYAALFVPKPALSDIPKTIVPPRMPRVY
ncbi:hypothetical protein WJX72_008960 [[Myrmecia] bisecta]|uniref:Peptidase S54 rhomboid domain-containing protein n=1 Tax=[Myrmecia] bisecta TaxID=41462 RepID=A0AAW1P892_9CHLO